ncbi:MAG: monovalent cation/H+ antiporter complex subunit F [Nitriliruptoraceae bacterium]
MSPFLVTCMVLTAVLIAAGLFRVYAGPTVFDRLVAVAMVSVNGIIVLVLLGLAFERPDLFFDIALGFAMLAFLFPVVLGRYFERHGTTPGQGTEVDRRRAGAGEEPR